MTKLSRTAFNSLADSLALAFDGFADVSPQTYTIFIWHHSEESRLVVHSSPLTALAKELSCLFDMDSELLTCFTFDVEG